MTGRSHSPLDTVRTMLEIVVIAIFVVTFIVQPSRIPSESMVPTLRVGDFLLVDKQSYAASSWVLPPAKVHRGDLVVFRHAGLEEDGWRPLDLVKRVVGLPGDRVHLRDNLVYINGEPLVESYAMYTASMPDSFRDDFPSLLQTDPEVDPAWWMQLRRSMADGEVTVPAGEFFVLGDNRNDSDDSRFWGFVPEASLVGRPLVTLVNTGAGGHSLRGLWRTLHVLR